MRRGLIILALLIGCGEAPEPPAPVEEPAPHCEQATTLAGAIRACSDAVHDCEPVECDRLSSRYCERPSAVCERACAREHPEAACAWLRSGGDWEAPGAELFAVCVFEEG
jgi:hypothetical protein